MVTRGSACRDPSRQVDGRRFFPTPVKTAAECLPWAHVEDLRCPCGTVINAADDDELVALTQEHLAAEHPGREYTRDEILFMAAW